MRVAIGSRFQVHALLKDHHVPLQYTAADLDGDLHGHRERGILPSRLIVVADSGPLHYPILLEHIDLLHRFCRDSTIRSWQNIHCSRDYTKRC